MTFSEEIYMKSGEVQSKPMTETAFNCKRVSESKACLPADFGCRKLTGQLSLRQFPELILAPCDTSRMDLHLSSVMIAAADPNESEEEEEQQQPERLVPWYELMAAVMVEEEEEAHAEMKTETTELLHYTDPLTSALNRLAETFLCANRTSHLKILTHFLSHIQQSKYLQAPVVVVLHFIPNTHIIQINL